MSPMSVREANRARAAAAARATGTVAVEPKCDDLFARVMNSLLECADQALTGCERPVTRAFLATGQIAWDDCCDGQLWVRMINAAPSGRPFPQADNLQPCGITLLAVRLGVGVLRCAHTIDDQGTPPTPDELTDDALNTTLDASILLSAIQCCPLPGISAEAVRVGAWTPLGPQGGCAGGEWQITVGVDGCGC